MSEELLVASTDLRLYQTTDEETLIWSWKLSSPAAIASFSPDSTLIASNGRYDRLLKIWRRLSYGLDDVRFDFSYLSHPATVTGIQWRASSPSCQAADNVLYTICADNKVRVWTATEPHASQVLQLWTEIDIRESIQPRHLDPVHDSSARYVFFVHSYDFKSAIDAAYKNIDDDEQQRKHVLEHLAEISDRTPEICVVLDDRGHMSAWGMENIEKRVRSTTDVFNFAHFENCNILRESKMAASLGFVQFLTFCTDEPEIGYAVLAHHFDGRIVWLEGYLNDFFDPTQSEALLQVKALWTGHEGSIKKIQRTISGQALISRTNDNESLIWKQRHDTDAMALTRQSLLDSSEHIHRTWLLANGNFTINLHHQSISLWDTRSLTAIQIARCEYQIVGKPLCLLQLPSSESTLSTKYLATISSNMKGIVWELVLPIDKETKLPAMRQFCSFDLGMSDNLAFVIPVDPAGSAPIAPGFLDTFAKDVALSYTNSGILHTWTAKVNPTVESVDWLLTSTVETGIDRPFLASGSSIRKIALVNESRNGLTIWDSRSGQLEYGKEYPAQEMVQDLDWTSTPDEQSILALGFAHKVIILAQMRYDYLDNGPAWVPIREINIRDSTPHQIGDSTWLGSGNLVVGAGTQLFIYDKLITTSDEMVTDLLLPTHGHTYVDLFDVVALLNGPLPLYHPQFLAQCILAGKHALVSKIIVSLNNSLKFSAGDHVDSLLDISLEQFIVNEQVFLKFILLYSSLTNIGSLTELSEGETGSLCRS